MNGTEDTDDGGPADTPGTRFPGFRLAERLGSGGSGVVYRAYTQDHGWVALKILRAGRWASKGQRARFRREVEVHRRLDDPGVVMILDDGVSSDGAPWLSMELVDGPSLQQVLGAGTLPDLGERLRWISVLARTLSRLHARGIYHRDVKPGNVLLSGGREPRLADFGIVMAEDEGHLSAGTHAVGTPRFMPPEQLGGDVTDWARVDLYALGVVLTEVTGSEERSGDLAWVVARATAPAAADRYASLSSFADDIDRLVAGRSVRLRGAAMAWRLNEGLRRPVSRASVVIASLLLVSGAALLLGVAASDLDARRQARATADWAVARETMRGAWRAGDHDGAERRVAAFVSEPAHASLPAAGVAWLDLAAEQRAAGLTDAEVLSIGNAVAATADGTVRQAAAARLVDLYRATRRWDALERLLGAGIPLDREREREAACDAAMATGDFAAAVQLLPPERGRLLSTFLRVEALPDAVIGGIDVGGAIEWISGLAGPEAIARVGDGWEARSRLADLRVDPVDGGLFVHGDRAAFVLDGRGVRALPADTRAFTRAGGREFTATTRRLLAATGPAHPPTDGLDAYVTALEAGDLDGDGTDEVVAAFGPRFGFLARVYRVGGATPLVAIADVRPGFVGSVAVLDTSRGPRLLGVITHENPSALLFGDDDPWGGPERLMVWRLDGNSLRLEQEILWEPGNDFGGRIRVADLDGDGTDEVIIAGDGPGFLVLRQAAAGLERAFQVVGYTVEQVITVQGGADRLLIGDGAHHRWVVGGGGPDTLPRTPFPAREAHEASDPLITLFDRLSLDAAAAVAAEQRGDPALAAGFWRRAGNPGRAAAASLAAGDPREAFDLAMAEPDLALAARIARRDPGLDVRLDGLSRPAWTVDLSKTLPAAVGITIPQAVEHDLAVGALRLTVPSSIGTVLRVPLTSTGGPVWLEVAGTWARAEWGSDVSLVLRRSAGDVLSAGLGVAFRATGAGNVLFREIVPLGKNAPSAVWARREADPRQRRLRAEGPAVETRFDLRLDAAAPVVAGEDWDLSVIAPSSDVDPGQLGTLVLERLRIGGLAIREPQPAPASPYVAWAMGGSPPTLFEPRDPVLVGLVRLDPAVTTRVASTWGEPAAGRAFAAAWAVDAWWHRDDPVTVEGVLDAPPLQGVPAGDRLALQLARGEALLHRGRLPEAGRVLLDTWTEACVDPQDWSFAFDAAALLAEIALTTRDDREAQAWAGRAAGIAPDPDLGRALLVRRGRLRPLIGHPGWDVLGD